MAGWRTLTGSQLYRPATLLITLGWSVWAGLATGQSADRAATAAVLALATLSVLRVLRLPLLAIAGATAVHGWLTGTPASIVLFGAALCAVSYGVSVVDSQRGQLAEQHSAQAALGQLLDERTTAHDHSRDIIVAEVQRIIETEVAQLDTPRTVAAQLRRLAIDVVRPVSYELAAELRRWEPPAPLRTAVSLSWPRVWRAVTPAAVLDPLRLGAGLTVVALASGPLDTLLVAALVPLTSRVVARIVARFPRSASDLPTRLLSCAAVLELAVLPAAAIGQSPLLAAAAPIVGSGWALLAAVQSESAAAQRAMARSLAQLEWAAARMSLVAWFHRGEVNRGLHGPIPLAISQLVPRLADAVSRSEPTFAPVGELQRRIVHGLGALVNPRAEGADLERELDELAQTWGGTANIVIDVPADLLPPLSADPACATAVVDTLTEACASAVRGGSATTVHLEVAAATNAVLITVVDDGRYDASAFEAELTARLLDQCAIRWFRKRSGNRNVLVALLPYRPDTATGRPVALPPR